MSSRHLKSIACLNPGGRLRLGAPERFEILKTEPLHQGYFSVNRYTLRHQTFEGGWTEPFTREVFERGQAVVALPYDPIADAVVMIEQFRIGAMVAGWHPWLTEIAAGMIEPGETPETVARRETAEETGLHSGRAEFIAHILSTPGGSSETLAFYCVEVDSTKAPEHAGLPQENEDIRVFAMPAAEAIALLDTGCINNASTLLALQWFALNHARIRSEWRNGKEDR